MFWVHFQTFQQTWRADGGVATYLWNIQMQTYIAHTGSERSRNHQKLTSSVFAMSCSLGQSMLAFLAWHLAGVVPNLVGIRTIGSNWDTDGYFYWQDDFVAHEQIFIATVECLKSLRLLWHDGWQQPVFLWLNHSGAGNWQRPWPYPSKRLEILECLWLSWVSRHQSNPVPCFHLNYQPGQWLSLRTRTILTQAHMMAQMDAVLDKSRLVNGKPTSLAESAS